MLLADIRPAASMALVGANVGAARLLAEAPPIPLIAFLRCAVAVAVLWPLALMARERLRIPRDMAWNRFRQALPGEARLGGLLPWYAGLKRAPAGTAGVFTAFLPAASAIIAVLLGEAFGLTHAAGFALMLGSVLPATWPGRKGQG